MISVEEKLNLDAEIKDLVNSINKYQELYSDLLNDNYLELKYKQDELLKYQQKMRKLNIALTQATDQQKKYEEELQLENFKYVEQKALNSLNGIVEEEIILDYKTRLFNSKTTKDKKAIIDSINKIVMEDYKENISNVDNLNENYAFICHAIGSNTFDNMEYGGNFISCSLLTNEISDTYANRNIGLIYSADSIIAADSKDIATSNNANSIDDVLLTQAYPTIKNIKAMIAETKVNKQYNEIVVKNSEPIGIFVKAKSINELDVFSKKILDDLINKYPNLNIIYLNNLGKNMEANIVHPKAKELNQLEIQKKKAKENSNVQLYDNLQKQIQEIVNNNRMKISKEQWNSLNIEDKIKFVNIKLKEAHILGNKDEFDHWNDIIKSLKQKGNGIKFGNIDDLKEILNSTNDYETLVHGTLMTEQQIKDCIFTQGLYATGTNMNSSLFKTGNMIDLKRRSNEEIVQLFNNWSHSNANMVIVGIPKNYCNLYCTDSTDLDCGKTRAFMDKFETNEGYKYKTKPKFVIGSYNTQTGKVMLNQNFEKNLTNETKQELQENLEKLYADIGYNFEEIRKGMEEDLEQTSRNMR